VAGASAIRAAWDSRQKKPRRQLRDERGLRTLIQERRRQRPPGAGNTVVVSTAAGVVGSCVGQIAKIRGCRTVGIAGGPQKVWQCLEEFGYDAAIDFKAGGDLDEALRRASLTASTFISTILRDQFRTLCCETWRSAHAL
jgi:NADPH:quinone reductase-like Zn-dependent oxidoreductase